MTLPLFKLEKSAGARYRSLRLAIVLGFLYFLASTAAPSAQAVPLPQSHNAQDTQQRTSVTAQDLSPQSLIIRGTVKSGNVPIPGATVTATSSATNQKVTTWTDLDGNYALQVPSQGHYSVRVEMAAFAPATPTAPPTGATCWNPWWRVTGTG